MLATGVSTMSMAVAQTTIMEDVVGGATRRVRQGWVCVVRGGVVTLTG